MSDVIDTAVEVVGETRAWLGEGPVWDARSGRLVWVDILGHLVHQTDPATGADDPIEVPLAVSAIRPREAGGFVAALEDGFWVVGDGPPRRIATVPEAGPHLRFNDGSCDPVGRFWAGTMAWAKTPGAASLYRLDPDGPPTRVLDGATISNGIAWNGAGDTMYYIDTPTRRVDAFSFDAPTGSITDRRIAAVVDGPGFPDGMTIDAEDGLWVAIWNGGEVRRYVDGRVDRVIRLPVTRPTSCAFGGATLGELFITSSREDLTAEELAAQPLAGALFRCRPGVRGVLPSRYRG